MWPAAHRFLGSTPAGCQFEGSNEVGVWSRLTNAYALVCVGGSESFYSVYEAALADHIPVIHTTVAGCRFVGRVCVGAWLGGAGWRAAVV